MKEGTLPKIYVWRWPTIEDAAKDPAIIEWFKQFNDAIPIIRRTSEFKLKDEEK